MSKSIEGLIFTGVYKIKLSLYFTRLHRRPHGEICTKFCRGCRRDHLCQFVVNRL